MVSIQNITKSYDGILALDSISLEIKRGELFGFIGPDGAGKTSLFRILTTLLLPNSGSASLAGLDLVIDYKQIRLLLGYMPGKFSLYQDLSIEENLEFFASVFGTTLEKNYDLIRDIYVQIEPFKERRAGQLSGGMKQKLALCCALIHKPEILILDEPTTGVDAVSRQEFWHMLKTLQKSGITIMVSTPYMDEANLCDRIALIQSGKILATDSPSVLTQRFPKKLYAIRSATMHRLLTALREYEFTESAYAFGEFIHYTDRRENLDNVELSNFLVGNNLESIEIKDAESTIEDVFIRKLA